MVEADETLELLTALEERASAPRLKELFERPELRRVFPALGLPTAAALALLEKVVDPDSRHGLDEVGTMLADYVGALVACRREFEKLLVDVRANEEALVNAAFERTRKFLPEPCVRGTIRLVFLPLGYDFKTDLETAYMDPVAAVQLGPNGIERTLAHEFHHIARYRLTGVNPTHMRPEEHPPPDNHRDLFREWARWLETEGIADCVSNLTQTEIPSLRAAIEERRQQMARYEELLDGALGEFRKVGTRPDGKNLEVLRSHLNRLSHPVGYRMAGHILSELGRPALVSCVGHSDRFLESYNTVARAKGLTAVDPAFLSWTKGR